jgi:hypothetical protein
MRKILILILIFFTNNAFANQEEIKKMVFKSESYNLGLNKKDTTIRGVKLKPITKIEAFKHSVKKNYGWTKYGIKLVKSSEGLPIRYGDTAIRFELRYDDCGFLYKNGKERDCIRPTPHHRVELGQGHNKDLSLGFKHKQDYWYTASFYFPKEHKFYRKQSVFQFHSSEGPYHPPFHLEIFPKDGLMAKISTSEGVYADKENACGGSVKQTVNYCEKAELTYLIMNPDELENSLGKWTDLVIHAVWDKRPTDDKKNKGMIEVFINGKKKFHYKGQTMWDVGLTVMQLGIYQSKEAKTFKGKTPSLQEMRDTSTIMFYDEIWAKKKCQDLQLNRLGYSCENLERQSDDDTKPYHVHRASDQEYIVIVKNKIDKNVLIKLRGFYKESLIKKAMKECTKKNKDGCYVHYSSMLAIGQ